MDLTTQKEKETEIIDRVFFIAGMLGVLVVVLCVIWWKVTGKSPIPPVPPCMIHAVTGIYCPGCGGTRAAYALLCGKPLLSFYYHPIVLYTVVVGAAFLVTQTIGRLSRGRFRAVVHFRPAYLWIAKQKNEQNDGGDQLLCEKLHTAVFSYSIALTGKYTIGKGVINFF